MTSKQHPADAQSAHPDTPEDRGLLDDDDRADGGARPPAPPHGSTSNGDALPYDDDQLVPDDRVREMHEVAEEDDDESQLEEDEIAEVYESSSSASSPSTLSWINWYITLPGHEYFCEVAEDFIEDDFNLTGLSALVPFYKEAMEMVLDAEQEEDAHRVPDVTIVESSAELLYGLIHQRYIITRQGLQAMYQKYDAGHFGQCPRVYCTQQKLVPCGRSDLPGVDTVKLFCPSCVDMYVPPSSRFSKVDGAFFGTTFPHLLFQTYPSAVPVFSTSPPSEPDLREPTTPLTSASKVYVPRIYGFKVSERSRSGPRMQWLRMRPRTEEELDWRDDDMSLSHVLAGTNERVQTRFDDNDDEEEEEETEEEEEDDAGPAGATPVSPSRKDGKDDQMQGVVGTPPVPIAFPAPLPAAKTREEWRIKA